MGGRQRGFNRRIGRYTDDAGIVGEQQRLIIRGAINLYLAQRLALETLDHDEIDRRQLCQQYRQPRLGGAAQLAHQRPALAGRHQNFGRTGLAMLPGIFAGHVDIEGMMGVLDDGNAQALFLQ